MTEEKTVTCTFPGCERPAPESNDLQGCEKHLALFDARAEEEAWGVAHEILRPLVEATRPIGSDELTSVMEKALREVEDNVNVAVDNIELAEAALERGEE